MPRGGKRPGTGPKPKNPLGVQALAKYDGPIVGIDPPEDLSPEARAVWMQQAPWALAHRTLTVASALTFARYCRIVVLEQRWATGERAGSGDHRGLLKLLQEYELAFILQPSGKAMPVGEREPDAPKQVGRGHTEDEFFKAAS